MKLIAKVSKGSRMDQIYIPKNRNGFAVGSYVILKPVSAEKAEDNPYFYNVKEIEPIKLELANEVFKIIDTETENYDNIIITGSFLEKGFNFNDIDLLLITNSKLDESGLKQKIEETTKIKVHLIILNNASLIKGLSADPLYHMMLGRCIAKKRFVFNVKRELNYKILDLHLLKSKTLIDNFDILSGSEKYYLISNMIAIFLFLQYKKIEPETVDKEIVELFNINNVSIIKNNMIDKKSFLQRYNSIYNDTFKSVMDGINNGSKHK